MIPAGNNDNSISGYLVNEAVFFGDAPAPASFESMFKGFGFAYTFIGIFSCIVQQFHYFVKNLFVIPLPCIVLF